MFSRIAKTISPGSWSREDRRWGASLGFSVMLHLGLIALLAMLHAEWIRAVESNGIDSRWSPEKLKTEKERFEFQDVALKDKIKTQESGGSAARFAAKMGNNHSAVLPVSPLLRDLASEIPETGMFDEDLLEEVGDYSDMTQSGSGKGIGNGTGDGFFGLNAEGLKFVYVVDASRSMNHPHDSPARTRFKRLKIELVNSISALNGNNEFFIVFFNENAIPMPARKMQPGVLSNRKKYLKWAAGVQADGRTDPRKALSLALKMNPDVIYFLTDGAFKTKVELDLMRLAQNRTAIHTFAFGNREAEGILKSVAFANRGKYHFVP